MNGAQQLMFYNYVMDRPAMRRMIGRLTVWHGNEITTSVLDQLKSLGFDYATRTGISLGIDDLLASASRTPLVLDAEYQAQISEESCERGSLHAVEKLRQVVETWHTTSEFLKREMSVSFQLIELMNPVHMMSFSGARGSASQVHQLVGMRGLMADPRGRIIDLPIQTNLREGLSLTEYLVSCYGARKGVVDTAIRTADAGYLTRRLVEVAQHLVIGNSDCGTLRGVDVRAARDESTRRYVLYQDRLIGRVLAQAVYVHGRCIAVRNQDVGAELAVRLAALTHTRVFLRSPLTCKGMGCVCQLCYGWSSNYGSLVKIGEAIGVIAGQSIGEPGTQLTLRTFHTGGVFTGDIANYVRTPLSGIVCFELTGCQPARNGQGRPAWLALRELSVVIRGQSTAHTLSIPSHSLLLVTKHQHVQSRQVLAEIGTTDMALRESVQKEIYASLQGQIVYKHGIRPLSRANANHSHPSKSTLTADGMGHVWILSVHLSRACKEPVRSVYQLQDRVRTSLPFGTSSDRQQSENSAALLRNARTQWSAMLSHPKRALWHDVCRQMKGGVSFEAQVLSASSGAIHSLLCADAKTTYTRRCAILSSADQFRTRFHPTGAVLDRPPFGSQAPNERRAHKEAPHAAHQQHGIRFADLCQATARSATLSRSVERAAQRFEWMREHITDAGPNNVSTEMLGCAHRWIGCLSVSMTDASTHAREFEWLRRAEPLSTRYRHRVTQSGPRQGIGCATWKERVPVLWTLVGSVRQTYRLPSLGNLLLPRVLEQHGPALPEVGKMICLSEGALVLRLAQCHLILSGTRVYGYSHEGLDEQQPLATVAYDRLRSSDIIQGLPKAEQLLEARLSDGIVFQFQYDVGSWMDALLPHLVQPYSLSAEKGLRATQSSLVARIQAVYLAQGVRIFDKHVEVIVRQMSSRVLFVQGVYHARHNAALLPGELIDFERARSISSVFQVTVGYRAVLLGISKTSLDADSFLAAASFQRTVSALSTSALQSKTDWVRGLQENVIFGASIPAGTGCEQLACAELRPAFRQGDDRLAIPKLKQNTASRTSQLAVAGAAQHNARYLLPPRRPYPGGWAKLYLHEMLSVFSRQREAARHGHRLYLELTRSVRPSRLGTPKEVRASHRMSTTAVPRTRSRPLV